jgi:hypothetical protein
MANRDLLKEAIADAKALKETAIANAKAALEEAFNPQLQAMFAKKLEEMEVEEEELDERQKYGGNKGDVPASKRGDKKDTAEEEGVEDYKKKVKEGDDINLTRFPDEPGEHGNVAGKNVDEMDLEELLAELNEEEDSKEMEESLNEAEEEEEMEIDSEEESEEEGGEEEEIDLEEMTEDELKMFIEDVIKDMVSAGELEAGEEFEAEEDMEDMEGEDEEELDIEDETEEIMEGEEEKMEENVLDKLKAVYNDPEVLGKLITVDGKKMSLKDFLAMAASGATGGMKKSGSGKTSSVGEAEDKMDEAYDEMEEMKDKLDELKAELHEVNLLNAKLLYTNKIFRAKNLVESQKVKVLEAFDKAATVSEVKLVYETLSEGIKEKAPIKENLSRASKPAGVAPKQQIVEVDSQVARWQKLAGIIK